MRHIYVDLRKTPPSIYGDTLIYEGENLITNITFRIPSEDNSLTFVIKFKPYRLPAIVTGPLPIVDNTISYIFTNAITAAYGLLQVQLNGFDSNGLLIRSSMINFKVEKSISEADEIMPESYIPWYSEISNTLIEKAEKTHSHLSIDITDLETIEGPAGADGYTPIKGIDYFDGAQGPQGPQGIQGEVGPQGLTGPQGEVGPQGIPGVKGDTGLQGIQGPTGETGLTGPQGIQGIQGEVGPQGPQGLQGEIGPQGPQGDDGYTPIKGVDYFDGAQGLQGETGLIGAKGDTGPQGLQGEIGPQGLQGPQGEAGVDGYTPIKGVDYFDGAQGIQGPQGETGPQGIQGIQGEVGPQGPQGLQGETGPAGATIASGVSIADAAENFTATDVEGALSELFTSVSSGKTLIAGAITDKGISTSATDTFSTMATNIGSISGGGAPVSVSPKDVNFYDYDGSLVASWTLAELASAVSLPANPSHAGLTAQGWNWTLADLKTENRAIDVGQMYITSDGKTKLYITIAAVGRMTVPLYWSQTVDSGVTIDWGDGSAPETFTGTGNKNTTHVYAAIGDYVITLEVTAGVLELGSGTSTYCMLGATSSAERVYTNMLQKIEIGSGVTSIAISAFNTCSSLASVVIPSSVTSISTNAFNTCSSLASVVIPSSMTSIGNYAFYNCPSLASVVIPSGVTRIGIYAFNNCPSLDSVIIPSSVTSIGNYAFQNCYSLASVVIPSGVTSIGISAFTSCSGMAEYHFQRTTPPTLANIDAFTGIPADCKIYVPLASLAAYQAATNWSTYASYMIGE